MNMSDDEETRFDRRRALKLMGFGITSVGGLIALGACSKAPEPVAAPAPKPAASGGICQLKVPIDDAARQLRRNLQYREKSDQPGKKCALCAQFLAGKYGECGGCKLFDGGVNPEGVCLSFAPLGAPAAPGTPAAPAAAPGKPG